MAPVKGMESGKDRLMDVSGRQIRPKPELLECEKISGGRESRTYAVSTEAQIEALMQDLREAGKNPKLASETQWTKQAVFEGIELSIEIGDPLTCRAVARQALNFLAHHHPTVVRETSLRPFLDYIEGNNDERCVWLEPNHGAEPLPPSPYRFGHRVIITLDVESQRAFGRLSFFDTFFYVIEFGPVNLDESITIIHDVNPLAEQARSQNDWSIWSQPGVALCRPRPALRDNFLKGPTAAAINNFYERAFTFRWEYVATSLIPRLEAGCGLSKTELRMLVNRVLEDELQRLVNLMRWAGMRLKAILQADLQKAVMAAFLNPLLQSDLDEQDHLSSQARQVLHAIRESVAEYLEMMIVEGPIDSSQLRSVLEGEAGRKIAMTHVKRYFRG